MNSALVKLGPLSVTHICDNVWVAKAIRKASTVGFVPQFFEFKGIGSIHLENESTSSKTTNTLPKNGTQNQGVLESKDMTPSPNDGWALSAAYFDSVDRTCSLLLRFQSISLDLATICSFWPKPSF